jgi:carbonic anhydrase
MMAKLGLFDVTCLGPRVDPSAFFGLELGDAAVIRNAAGHVSEALIRDVACNGQLAERHVRMGR